MLWLEGVGEEAPEESFLLLHVNAVSRWDTTMPPLKVQVRVEDCMISMEVDTGVSHA